MADDYLLQHSSLKGSGILAGLRDYLRSAYQGIRNETIDWCASYFAGLGAPGSVYQLPLLGQVVVHKYVLREERTLCSRLEITRPKEHREVVLVFWRGDTPFYFTMDVATLRLLPRKLLFVPNPSLYTQLPSHLLPSMTGHAGQLSIAEVKTTREKVPEEVQ